MSNLKAEVSIDWADGTYLFRLTVPCTIELEQKCDAPFTVIHNRLATNAYKILDVRETVRLGLIGGGMAPPKALDLVRKYVDERPIAENSSVARAILLGLLFGFEAEPLGNREAAPMTDPNVSTPPPSTETPPSWESPLKPLVRSRFGNSQQP